LFLENQKNLLPDTENNPKEEKRQAIPRRININQFFVETEESLAES
jgi:hypothetical protein